MEITIKEALEDAKRKEELAYEFYMKLYDYVSDLGAKTIIKELAEEEVKHKNLIQEMIDTGKIDSVGLDTKYYYTDLGITNLVLPKVITEDMSVQDVLRIAMKHEDNSRVFYEKLAEKYSGTPAEEVFNRLAVEESLHRNTIQKMYEDIVLSEN
ncbi:MAG: ferritin family protein [Deferribacterales bacterium]|uniref:ferritin family protein n=1 Tax=Deferrivibrio essentukiensis TaxID=2880922 RepID=UPI0019A0D417|nr:ferritin family protein [Deferrivibrio essentukiensis]MBC7195672.1 ferritin family protein [Deferribacterales bacterium]MBZ4672246.1 Rubrerythrin [Deferribacteraceae bacterium]MCB4203685.1 ferritin family protein [Deferrivibrio essentukiensis]